MGKSLNHCEIYTPLYIETSLLGQIARGLAVELALVAWNLTHVVFRVILPILTVWEVCLIYLIVSTVLARGFSLYQERKKS